MFVSEAGLEKAIARLQAWYKSVPVQSARHLWSLFPILAKGANSETSIRYDENDDGDFFDRFLKLREDHWPFFDPFSGNWLTETYAHSNASTMRKRTFVNSWHACTWQGSQLQLSVDFADVFCDKVLQKAGKVQRLPAIACASWFLKRPTVEWPSEEIDDRITDTATLVNEFRRLFSLEDNDVWSRLFEVESD